MLETLTWYEWVAAFFALVSGISGGRFCLQVRKGRPLLKGRSCGSCKHFDKEVWVRERQRSPAFAEAIRWVPPNSMATPLAVDANGDRLPDEDQPTGALPIVNNDWDDFGACVNPNSPNANVALSSLDCCPKWRWRK